MVVGGLLVVPRGLIDEMGGRPAGRDRAGGHAGVRGAGARRRDGNRAPPRLRADRPANWTSSATTSRAAFPPPARLRFIEVKGRRSDAETVTVTRNEILYSLNKPDDFILAIVEFRGDDTHRVSYVRRPFQREPDFGAASVNYALKDLLARG